MTPSRHSTPDPVDVRAAIVRQALRAATRRDAGALERLDAAHALVEASRDLEAEVLIKARSEMTLVQIATHYGVSRQAIFDRVRFATPRLDASPLPEASQEGSGLGL